MIEILDPAWLSCFVDGGRHGFAHIGVPSSAALDHYALSAVNQLLGNPPHTPVLEIMGKGFAFIPGLDVECAVTGAKVRAFVDKDPVPPWTSFPVSMGSTFSIKEVEEGFRYYVGFSGTVALERVMGSSTTNLECRFGGFKGRPLLRGDVLQFEETDSRTRRLGLPLIVPAMDPPHHLRVVKGPEIDSFTEGSLKKLFACGSAPGFVVSRLSNRTGVRLEGRPLQFRKKACKSIISEGILPGTIQVPGDGLPLIVLHERTIGGYARAGVIARADRDLLAHLKPGDRVYFELVGLEEAERLWERRRETCKFPIMS